MKIKIFDQGSTMENFTNQDFEHEVNKSCNQHDVVNVSVCSYNDGFRLITAVVTYRD